MGDLIHTLPALTDAARAIPGIRFDWVSERGFAEIPHWHPAVGDVIVSDLRRWKKFPLSSWLSKDYMAFRAALGASEYDAVIDAQGLLKSAWLIARLAHGEVHGYDKHSVRESWAAWTYNHRYSVGRDQHAIERTRQLFAQALGYELTGPADAGIASDTLQSNDVWLIHGTSRADKEWPEGHWRALAQHLSGAGKQLHIPAGSDAEIARAHRIASGTDAKIWERCSLSDIKTEMARAQAVVAVDTGLAHLADALERRLIMLFGPTNPGLVGPKGAHSRLLKADAMAQIEVQDVIGALDA